MFICVKSFTIIKTNTWKMAPVPKFPYGSNPWQTAFLNIAPSPNTTH